MDIIERNAKCARQLLEAAAEIGRLQSMHRDMCEVAGKQADEIKLLRVRNASLVEVVRDSLCPYNGRATGITVGDCQQCGCSHGLFIQPLTAAQP